MTRKNKLAAGVAGAVALSVAVGAAGAVAAERALNVREESQAVIDDAANQLGVESSELADALKDALKNRVDEEVQSGRLTEEQGAELKERIESGETPLIFPGFGRHRGDFVHGHGHLGKLDAAAEYLGLAEEELRDRLEQGRTLAEIAQAQGKPVAGLVDALVTEATSRIDEAVEDGHLTEERAAELKAGLEDRTQDLVEGALRFGRPPHHGGPGFGFRGGPHGFEERRESGPRA
jgi:hypothetical protein